MLSVRRLLLYRLTFEDQVYSGTPRNLEIGMQMMTASDLWLGDTSRGWQQDLQFDQLMVVRRFGPPVVPQHWSKLSTAPQMCLRLTSFPPLRK